MTQHIGQSVYRASLVAVTDIATFLSPVSGKLIEVAIKFKGGVNPNGVTNFRVRIEGADVGTVSIPANAAQGILTLTSPAARFAEVKIDATLVPVGGLLAPIYVFATFEDSQGLIKRSTVVYISPALASGAVGSTVIQIGRAFAVYRLQTSVAARVRLYTTAAYRDADVGRPFGTPPTGEHGVILDEATSVGNLTLDFANARVGMNLEAIVTDDIPALITNLSGGTVAVTISITRAVIEGAGAGGSFLLAVEEADSDPSLEINKLIVGDGDLELVSNGVARLKTAGDAAVGSQDESGVTVVAKTTNFVVADGDLEDLGGGNARIRTASDVVIPTPVIGAREVDNAPTLAGVQRLVVANGDLTDLGGGEARIKTASDVVLPTTLPPNGAAGGDLGSNYPNPTVLKLQGDALPATVAEGFLKRNTANNGWELYQLIVAGKLDPNLLPALALNSKVTVASQAAMLALASASVQPGDFAFRTDVSEVYLLIDNDPSILANWVIWLHPAMPSSLPPSGAAGGDLGSNYPNPTVLKLNGDALPATAANGFLKRNAANTGYEFVAYGTVANTVCQGNDARLSDSRTPTGAAGGDLGLTYPNPMVTQLKGRSIAGIPDIPGFLGDNFNDNVINPAIWSVSGSVTESSGRLNVPSASSAITINRANMVNHYCYFKVMQTSNIWIRFYHDAANTLYEEVRFEPTVPHIRLTVHNTGGDTHATFSLTGVPLADYVWIRVRHDNTTAKWLLDTAPDAAGVPGAWVNRLNQNLPTGQNASSCAFQVVGQSAGGWIDEINSDAPLSDPISTRNFWAMVWDNTGSYFNLIRALGIVPYSASGSPPVGAPSNLPAGHTAMQVENTNPLKLWIWNVATGAWNSQQF